MTAGRGVPTVRIGLFIIGAGLVLLVLGQLINFLVALGHILERLP